MEAAEDASLEAAIGWLVQTILVSLLAGKLEAWIRQVGLAGKIDKLKSEVERVEMVVSAVKGRAIGNKPLARSLARLKDLLYDADDVVDELDYYRLQQQVEGVTCRGDPKSVQAAEERSRGSAAEDIPSGSDGSQRSDVWKNFSITKRENGKAVEAKCIHCDAPPIKCRSRNGTSVLNNHLKSIGCTKKRGASHQLQNPSYNHTKNCKSKPGPNDQPPNQSSTADGMPVAAGSSRGDATPIATGNMAGDATTDATAHVVTGNSPHRKRKRTVEESAQTTTANTQTPRWNKAEWSNRIQEITRQLQEIRGDVRGVLKLLGSDSATSSTSDQRQRTSSLVQRKMYGRAEEKERIIKLMAEDRAEGVTVNVLPIVGIAGVGKTALAQRVYNDPTVEKQFERIWIWVSDNFDEVMVTREILDFVSRERHKGSPKNNEGHEVISRFSPSNQGISSFSMLREILKGYMESQSKRFLLVLDDVWDNLDDNRWSKLLAPFTSSRLKGNVIVVTTRNLSVAQRISTLEPVKLGALKGYAFWLLFKSHAFGDENHEGHQSLSIIGQKIAEKLKGNPLAAKSAGVLLREKLEIDHWSSILTNEGWKSLQLDGGIMPAFKHSYEQLPYHLQQCFSYCSIFPYNYQFLDEELVCIWISQGFVTCKHSNQRLEAVGRSYLTDLVNLGFFQQEKSYLRGQMSYAICGLMHDFARMISRTECATIDGLQYNEILPTTRHLSILTDSAYSEDQDRNKTRNMVFEENVRNTVTSVRKLRTLVLIGENESFFQLFQDIFQNAQNLRLLQMSATTADFEAFICSSVNPVHLRYFKRQSGEVDEDLPQVLSKFYHLQVLDVGLNRNPTLRNGMNNLVSLRHLVAEKKVHASIGRIGQMTSLQELKDFSVQESSGFDITQLQSMNDLVHLGVSQLKNIKSPVEAYGAKLRDKRHLEKLPLSWEWNDWEWNYTLSEDESDSDVSSEPFLDMVDVDEVHSPTYDSGPSCDIVERNKDSLLTDDIGPSVEPSMNIEKINKELTLMDDSDPSFEPSIGTATEVLEGLEPHVDLKHLRISGYNGISPTWLASNITSLQALHLVNCGKWKILPSLKRFPFLAKLELRNMGKVKEVLLPSLEELVLVNMPMLKRCSSTSIWDLNSSLRALQIKSCHTLEVFDLFKNYHKFEIKQKPWLPGLRKLQVIDCPCLEVLSPHPPSATFSELLINQVSMNWRMNGSSSDTLTIKLSHESRTQDYKIFAFHKLRSLKLMEIGNCEELFSRHVMPPGRAHEATTAANWKAFPSLESLSISRCGITTEWLCLTLRHAPVLEVLHLKECLKITQLLIEEEEDSQSNLTSSHAAAVGHPDVALTYSAIATELSFISLLKNIFIKDCPILTLNGGNKGLSRFTSLEKLTVGGCPKLLLSLVHTHRNDDRKNGRWLLPQSLRELGIHGNSPETLQPCFIENQTSLTKLKVSDMPDLKSLQLHSCTALEDLTIDNCKSLVTLVGLPSLGSLKCLEICHCPSLRQCLERLSMQGPELCPGLFRLETLSIPDSSLLTTSFCNHLTSLQCLKLSDWNIETMRLTYEQESGLQLLTSLQELEFRGFEKLVDLPAALNRLLSLKRLYMRCCNGVANLTGIVLPTSLQELQLWNCRKLEDLPEGLHSLPSLKKLQIINCNRISTLPVKGLPYSLKILKINCCSQELTEECRKLATRKLKVRINWKWIN